ncbi:hypothetical protein JCM19231_2443 [Vibrio ishigakensis]|uniref:Uncharacterized protein n=1 Tax=Vibrio ishigakensis TaxID=1481914 RepID=A0A0B8P0X4_9VIBR|nr:hypothetical protein JCM19231_2443 [Vibrio ishigakensis]
MLSCKIFKFCIYLGKSKALFDLIQFGDLSEMIFIGYFKHESPS